MHSRRSYSPLEIRKRSRNTVKRRGDFDGAIVNEGRQGEEADDARWSSVDAEAMSHVKPRCSCGEIYIRQPGAIWDKDALA